VISAIEKMLAEPRGRSTVARSVMFTELQRRLDDEHGPGVVPVPSRRTLYRLMVYMDRGRRNFVSEAYDITLVWLRDHRSDEWITVPWVYRSLAGQPFGLALWEHARRITIERSGPRPAEADIARNVADLLNRAHGQDLTPDEPKAVAVNANRPVRPQAEEPDDPAETPQPDDEPDAQAEPSRSADHGAYDVFNPGDVSWRLLGPGTSHPAWRPRWTAGARSWSTTPSR
jgi:hypothetical protein